MSDAPDSPDEFLTVAEVAGLLKLNQQTVRNMIDRGDLGAVRVGKRRIRVRQSQLDAFLAAGEMPAEPESDTEGESEAAELDPWGAVRNALGAVASAVDAEDQDALASALVELSDAVRALRD